MEQIDFAKGGNVRAHLKYVHPSSRQKRRGEELRRVIAARSPPGEAGRRDAADESAGVARGRGQSHMPSTVLSVGSVSRHFPMSFL